MWSLTKTWIWMKDHLFCNTGGQGGVSMNDFELECKYVQCGLLFILIIWMMDHLFWKGGDMSWMWKGLANFFTFGSRGYLLRMIHLSLMVNGCRNKIMIHPQLLEKCYSQNKYSVLLINDQHGWVGKRTLLCMDLIGYCVVLSWPPLSTALRQGWADSCSYKPLIKEAMCQEPCMLTFYYWSFRGLEYF